MDGPMERSHSGLDIYVMAPIVGSVDGVSTMIVWGGVGIPRYRYMTYLSQHQCRVGYIYIHISYLHDFDIKILCVLCFQRVYVL